MMCPRVAWIFAPGNGKRAQGRPGARCTRGLVCKMHIERRTRAYRFSGGNPAFPALWCYGLLRALPGDRAFLPPSLARRGSVFTNLAPASGRQDHTTSPSASVCVRLSQAPRPPHPTARVVTCATPLSSGETGQAGSADLPDGLSEIFFEQGLDRAAQVLGDLPVGHRFCPDRTNVTSGPRRLSPPDGGYRLEISRRPCWAIQTSNVTFFPSATLTMWT